MTTSERAPYRKAPIREAIIDIRVRFAKPPSISVLDSLHDAIKGEYPGRQARISLEANISIPIQPGSAGISSNAPKEDGYLHISPDGKQVVQTRFDGFTFNRMEPYDRWSTFSGEAKRLWPIYRAIAAGSTITRLALRYINSISVPTPCNLQDYVLTVPMIAPALPQDVKNYFMRLVLPYPRAGAEATIAQTLEPAQNGRLPIIFDIDVYKTVDLPVDEEEIWKHFDELRDLKNEIFEKSTTQATKDLFK